MKKRMLCFVLSCVMSVGALFGCANSEQAPSKPSVAATVETELETEKETVAESDDMTESSNTSDNHKHSYTQKITKEPTCDEKGIITYTCTCGDSYTEETSYLDHCTDRSEITKKATCEEEGIETFYCIFCGKTNY